MIRRRVLVLRLLWSATFVFCFFLGDLSLTYACMSIPESRILFGFLRQITVHGDQIAERDFDLVFLL